METNQTIKESPVALYQNGIDNFDLSIIMSFYKRYEEFARILPQHAPFFQRNGIEVIIAMDEPTEKEKLLELLKKYPLINWKLIVNEQKHEPRNHAPVLNVALKHATKKYVMQIDPEVECYTDAILQMRTAIAHYPKHYILGYVAYIPYEMTVNQNNINSLDFIPWGSIMVERSHLEAIKGFDETFSKWGGEDDNIRVRLDMLGVKKLLLPSVLTMHREKNYNPKERADKVAKHTPEDWKKMRYPTEIEVNPNGWGNEFNNLVYSWENNIYNKELCLKYLNRFKRYDLKSKTIFTKKYKKLLLCQAHNEEKFMTGFLDDMAKYFDGIILLDDESTDNTWELANHEKMLLKVTKKREGFNDIQNRNILLDLASFFRTEWLCFMDIDERFDERFVNFKQFEDNPKIDVVAFRAVYLWNNEHTYKGDVPYADDGILKVYRMFRSIGRTQIITNKKLHFVACPYKGNELYSNILFKDYGSMDKERRKQKYKMYKKEDVQQDLDGDYSYLLNDDNLCDLSSLEKK